MSNTKIVLVTGKPSSGKSTSLIKYKDNEKVAYFNTDNKLLPFPYKFKPVSIKDPRILLGFIDKIENSDKVELVALDTLTFLMDMFETQYVLTAKNTQKAWGDYSQFYKKIMHKIKAGTKDYVIYAHDTEVYNNKDMINETKIPVKGAVGKTGVEADFSVIVSAKKVPISTLEQYENEHLTISDREKAQKYKYVFQTYVDEDTIYEKMRSPIGMWEDNEKYINNDVSIIFNRIKQYYNM